MTTNDAGRLAFVRGFGNLECAKLRTVHGFVILECADLRTVRRISILEMCFLWTCSPFPRMCEHIFCARIWKVSFCERVHALCISANAFSVHMFANAHSLCLESWTTKPRTLVNSPVRTFFPWTCSRKHSFCERSFCERCIFCVQNCERLFCEHRFRERWQVHFLVDNPQPSEFELCHSHNRVLSAINGST